MKQKIKELLGSRRFWQLVLAAAAALAAAIETHGFKVSDLLIAVSALFTASATVGTFDKFSQKNGQSPPAS